MILTNVIQFKQMLEDALVTKTMDKLSQKITTRLFWSKWAHEMIARKALGTQY